MPTAPTLSDMSRRLAGVVPAVFVLCALTACGPNGQLTKLAGEIAEATGASADDILRGAEQEASATSSSADDILRLWRRDAAAGASQGVVGLRRLPPEARSATCSAVTDVLADALDGDDRTDPSPLVSVLESLRDLNQNAEAQALVGDLEGATTDLGHGDSATLTLLLVKAGTCEVVAP